MKIIYLLLAFILACDVLLFFFLFGDHESKCREADPSKFTCKEILETGVELTKYISDYKIYVPPHIKDKCLVIGADFLNKYYECKMADNL